MAQMRSRLCLLIEGRGSSSISTSNCPSVAMCSCGLPLHRLPEGNLSDISLKSWYHISVFLPLCHFLSLSLISLFLASSFGCSSFLLVWFVSLFFCHSSVGRDDRVWKKKKEYSMQLPWQLHLGAEPVLFHRHSRALSFSLYMLYVD